MQRSKYWKSDIKKIFRYVEGTAKNKDKNLIFLIHTGFREVAMFRNYNKEE